MMPNGLYPCSTSSQTVAFWRLVLALGFPHKEAAIQSRRMELKQGDVSSLPYPAESFDIAFSLHSIYFWPKPLDCLKEIRRVLKPGGLLAITIQPKDKWANRRIEGSSIMTLYFGSELATIFSDAGYRNIRVEVPSQEDKIFLECILGVK